MNEKPIYYHFMPELQMKILCKITMDVVKLLDKYKISYWMDGGTLLGCVRDKGFIPWDYDVDLGVLKDDLPKMKWVLNKLKKKDYHIVDNEPGVIKISVLNEFVAFDDGYHIPTPTLDIFIYDVVDEVVQLTNTEFRLKWPGSNYNINDLFPLQEYDFGSNNFTMFGANNPNMYLDQLYPNWRCDAVVTIHRTPLKTDPIFKIETETIIYKDFYIKNNIENEEKSL